MKSRSFWKRFGACAILAGLAIAVASRFTERRKETEVSAQILERLSSREASAVAQLFQTSLNTRIDLLSGALYSAADVERLRVHEQGLSIALSRVKSSDAGTLFRRSILPALAMPSCGNGPSPFGIDLLSGFLVLIGLAALVFRHAQTETYHDPHSMRDPRHSRPTAIDLLIFIDSNKPVFVIWTKEVHDRSAR
jgi:hypothetical protein